MGSKNILELIFFKLKGLLTEEEKEIMLNMESSYSRHVCGRWRGWIPLTWSIKLLNEMRREKLIGNFRPVFKVILNRRSIDLTSGKSPIYYL